jgi:hypothetical protein
MSKISTIIIFTIFATLYSGCAAVKPDETYSGVYIKRITEEKLTKRLRIKEPIEFSFKQKVGGMVGFQMSTKMVILPGDYVLTAIGNGNLYYRHIEKGIEKVELGIRTHQLGGISISEKAGGKIRGWSKYHISSQSGNIMTIDENPNMFLEYPALKPEVKDLIEML